MQQTEVYRSIKKLHEVMCVICEKKRRRCIRTTLYSQALRVGVFGAVKGTPGRWYLCSWVHPVVIWTYHFDVKIIGVWWTDFQLQVCRPCWLAASGEGNRFFVDATMTCKRTHEPHMFCFEIARACCTGWENYAGDCSRWNAVLPGNQ